METEQSAQSVEIRPATEADLTILEHHFAPDSRARDHVRRFAVQQHDEGRYLIAWHGTEPVGHFLVRWDGPAHDPTGQYPPRTAYLGAGQVKPAYRRMGIGTHLIREAERNARAWGCEGIGLTVGSTDNPLAKRLYERLGYHDWGGGEYTARWEYETADGTTAIGTGVCIYLLKAL
jgi:GNAT superfamily N-acetyltransferase